MSDETRIRDTQSAPMRTRALFERLATTDHRRSLTADRIFRQLRALEESRERPSPP